MSNFDEFEARLKREMERVKAPDGFTDRVMERVADKRESGSIAICKRPFVAGWMTVAAMVLAGIVLVGWQWKQRELRKERERAAVVQRQFDLAMQVTQKTLAGVQQRVGKTVRDSVRQ